MPNATPEEKEAAIESLRRLAKIFLQIERRQIEERKEKEYRRIPSERYTARRDY